MTTRPHGPRASTPAEAIELFGEALNRGDLETMVALYDPEAAFLPQPGQPLVAGLDAIREALAGFLALGPTITGTVDAAIEADGVALVLNRWSLTGTDPAGESITLGGISADVMRQQSDGRWLILIDNPWGTA